MPYKFLNKYPKKFRGTGIIVPVFAAVRRIIKSTIHRPVTIMYPYEKEWVPDNYRGRPGLRFDRCLGCGICVRACPTTCIELVEVADDAYLHPLCIDPLPPREAASPGQPLVSKEYY